MLRQHATRRLNVRKLTDDRCLRAGKIKREVVGVAFMHDFHTKTSSVKDVRPRVYHMTFTRSNGLIEVESIEVECHGADAEGGKPDPHDWAMLRGKKCSDRELLKEAYWKIKRPK